MRTEVDQLLKVTKNLEFKLGRMEDSILRVEVRLENYESERK